MCTPNYYHKVIKQNPEIMKKRSETALKYYYEKVKQVKTCLSMKILNGKYEIRFD